MPRVLIVDDEPSILQLASLALKRDAEVATAESAEAALALFEAAGAEAPFDLLLTDQRMPGMSGLELIERVRARWPATICCLSTGFLPDEPNLVAQVRLVLPKPWSPRALRAALLEVLAVG